MGARGVARGAAGKHLAVPRSNASKPQVETCSLPVETRPQHLGAEFAYKLPSAPLTLLVGTQFWLRIFESEDHDKDLRDDWSDQWKFWFGANFELNKNIALNGQIILRSQDLNHRKNNEGFREVPMEGDALGFALDMEFKF